MNEFSVIDPWAVGFVEKLVREFRGDVAALLAARDVRRKHHRGTIGSLEEEALPVGSTANGWTCTGVPLDLMDRRVEITGPGVDPKMVVGALNSGAQGYMVDGEDSLSPTWEGVLATHKNVALAARGALVADVDGQVRRIEKQRAVLHYRPRGLHMYEANWDTDGSRSPAFLVDVGLFLFHSARALLERGSGPYLYIPKLEHEHEAAFVERVFSWAEEKLGLPRGVIRCTVLIETLPGLLRSEGIVWELRRRLTGLNVGRWDYIFSCIKVLGEAGPVLPDRRDLVMTAPALSEYARWVVRLSHVRGLHAIGGMAADVPNKRDPEATARAVDAVRRDKEREVRCGHDGTWVAHPGLVATARSAFDSVLCGRVEQRNVVPSGGGLDVEVLTSGFPGRVTREGVAEAVRSALVYTDSWLRGTGCVAMSGKMEDAATAEISRALLWRWIGARVELEDGGRVDVNMVTGVVRGEAAALVAAGTEPRDAAIEVLWRSIVSRELPEFLTTEAYEFLNNARVRTAPR